MRRYTITPTSSATTTTNGTTSKKRGRPSAAAAAAAAAAGEEENGGKKKRERKPKDPNAPKRPASAYILFQNEVRRSVSEQHPNLNYREVLGEVSLAWASLDPARKAIYQETHDKEKAVYDVQKAAYDLNQKRSKTQTTSPQEAQEPTHPSFDRYR